MGPFELMQRAFKNTKEIGKILKDGGSVVRREGTAEDEGIYDIIRRVTEDGNKHSLVLADGSLKLDRTFSLGLRYADRGSLLDGTNRDNYSKIAEDLASVGFTAAAGIIGFKAVQSGISLVTGDW